MIKIDYEGAWKEMKDYLNLAPDVYMYKMALLKMKELEQKHIHNNKEAMPMNQFSLK